MMRPRVMQLVVGGDIGGAERLLIELAQRPDETGADHEVALFTPNRALRELLLGAGLVVHDRGPIRENPLAYLTRSLGHADVGWLADLLVLRHTDILHTHTFGSHVLGTRAARRARIPQLRTEHDVMHYFDPSCAPFTRWAAARTERIVAVSEHVARVLQKTAPRRASRTAVVRNGVDVDHWSPGPAPLPSEPFSAAIVGRLAARKRVHLAIEAAALADVTLIVVGDGEERRRLEALAESRHARVRFAGHVADPRPFLRASDVTLNTCKIESLGLSVLESLAMERPVIAFARGGIPEIIQHGTTGWLVQDESAKPVAAALRHAKDERERLAEIGAAARRFVTRHATVNRMCEGYRAEYAALWRRT
jgi:glycosyltransferase involved in cell wall biosynthesis